MKTKQTKEAPIQATEATPGRLESVELRLIHPSKTNPRTHFDETALTELAESITKHGLIEPILLRPDGEKFEIVVGERRYRASKLAKETHILARIMDMTDQDSLEVQVIENLQRADLSPLEEATGYDKLIREHGFTSSQLAMKVGKSTSYIEQRRQLVSLCPKARKDFEDGHLTLTHALYLARIPDPKLQEDAIRQGYGSLNTSNLKHWIESHVCTSLKSAPFDLTDSILVEAAGACTTCPYNTAVSTDLFDGFKTGEQCTKPSCYNKKVTAFWRKTTAECKEKNQEVLSRSKSDKIFSSGRFSSHTSAEALIRHDSGYVVASAKCDLHPKKQTWNQIIGKQLTPILALTKALKVVKLFREKDIIPLVRDEKWFKKSSIVTKNSRPGAGSSMGHDWEKERREKDFSNQAYRMGALQKMQESDHTDLEQLRSILLADLAGTEDYSIQNFNKQNGLEKGKGARAALIEYIMGLDMKGLLIHLFKATLSNEREFRYILEESGVDIKAFSKQVKKDFKQSEKDRNKELPKILDPDEPEPESEITNMVDLSEDDGDSEFYGELEEED